MLVVERDHSLDCQPSVSTFADREIVEQGENLPPNALVFDETTGKPTHVNLLGYQYRHRTPDAVTFHCGCRRVKLTLNLALTHYTLSDGVHTTKCGKKRGNVGRKASDKYNYEADGKDIARTALDIDENDCVIGVYYDSRRWSANGTYPFKCPCHNVSLALNPDRT